MKVKCSICGFENDISYGNYCVRCRSILTICNGNCRNCLKKTDLKCNSCGGKDRRSD